MKEWRRVFSVSAEGDDLSIVISRRKGEGGRLEVIHKTEHAQEYAKMWQGTQADRKLLMTWLEPYFEFELRPVSLHTPLQKGLHHRPLTPSEQMVTWKLKG